MSVRRRAVVFQAVKSFKRSLFGYKPSEVDKALSARDTALAKLHARIVEEAPFVWIAHDVGPRAMSAKVKNVVQPRSWFIDIATMTMD